MPGTCLLFLMRIAHILRTSYYPLNSFITKCRQIAGHFFPQCPNLQKGEIVVDFINPNCPE